MNSNVIIMSSNSKMYLTFKEHETNNALLSGTIEELERENNKAYKRLKNRYVKDFYINIQSIVIWV